MKCIFLQNNSAPECTICEAGYYCDTNTTSQLTMELTKFCPAGTHCDPGRTEPPDLLYDACPAGFYCPRGDQVCMDILLLISNFDYQKHFCSFPILNHVLLARTAIKQVLRPCITAPIALKENTVMFPI